MASKLFWSLSAFLLIVQVSSFGNSTFASRQQANSAEDEAFVRFVWLAMRNYTNWLTSRDPFLLRNETKLKSDKRIDFGVDADFDIVYQNMSGHSKPHLILDAPVSDMEMKFFSMSRGVSAAEIFTFGGEYAANGTIQGDNGQNDVCFRGSGKWALKTIETFEYATFINFTVNEEGYINLERTSQDNTNYLYTVGWTEIDFEGLELICPNGNSADKNATSVTAGDDEVLKNRIKNALAQVYTRFLNSFRQFPVNTNPPKLLLYGYLTEILLETKLADIILGTNSTTTAEPISSTTSTPPPSSTRSKGTTLPGVIPGLLIALLFTGLL